MQPPSPMSNTTQCARVTGPISYLATSGRRAQIPLGPCILERGDGELIDIVWGHQGQSSTALPTAVVQAAQDEGHLLMLD
jgi:hypothetical protein